MDWIWMTLFVYGQLYTKSCLPIFEQKWFYRGPTFSTYQHFAEKLEGLWRPLSKCLSHTFYFYKYDR